MSSVPNVVEHKFDRRKLSFISTNPILAKYHDDAEKQTWNSLEIPVIGEKQSYEKLPSNLKSLVKYVLGQFAGTDGLVIENLEENFEEELGHIPDIKNTMTANKAMEVIHNKTYTKIIKAIFTNEDEQREVLESSVTMEAVQRVHDWVIKHMSREIPLEERIIAIGFVEGVIFSSLFAAIHYLKTVCQGDEMRGLTMSNEFIAIDEGKHTDFAIEVYRYMTGDHDKMFGFDGVEKLPKVSQERVYEIANSAVELAISGFKSAVPNNDIVGLSHESMSEYIKYIADVVLCKESGFGYEPLYNAHNPFTWMTILNIRNKTNFFEHTATEYKMDIDMSVNWDSVKNTLTN